MASLKKLSDYTRLLEDLKARIQAARTRAALVVNRELIALYWDMGKMIIERQQKHGWGDAVIDRLSRDLRREFPDNKGFSRSNLFYMRQFYLTYKDDDPIVQQLAGQIPWWHNVVIFSRVKDSKAREYYLRASIENGWSRNILVHQIETDAYARHALAVKTTSYHETLPAPLGEQAEEMLKDPYVFDFIGLEETAKETQIEKALIARVRDFLLELGKGFAFLGSQYRLEVGGEEFFINLLFFHRGLRCLVAIELKAGDFKPEYAGKMNFYLNVLDDLVRLPDENPSIGIILCKGKNHVVAEYALRGVGSPVGVAEYQLTRQLPKELQRALPSAAELEQQLKVGGARAMKPWHQVVVPHPDIRAGKFDESVFAADLSDVIADRGPLEYRDAETFFRKTYPTQGLVNLLSAIVSRLSGQGKGEAVIQIQTPFGGGKTHSLIALYHLFIKGDELISFDAVSQALKQAGVSTVPKARVARFVGTAADPLKGKTPWGELAEQLGNYSLLRAHDQKRRAPGKDLLHQLLAEKPTLILMDEIAEYAVIELFINNRYISTTIISMVSQRRKCKTKAVAES